MSENSLGSHVYFTAYLQTERKSYVPCGNLPGANNLSLLYFSRVVIKQIKQFDHLPEFYMEINIL